MFFSTSCRTEPIILTFCVAYDLRTTIQQTHRPGYPLASRSGLCYPPKSPRPAMRDPQPPNHRGSLLLLHHAPPSLRRPTLLLLLALLLSPLRPASATPRVDAQKSRRPTQPHPHRRKKPKPPTTQSSHSRSRQIALQPLGRRLRKRWLRALQHQLKQAYGFHLRLLRARPIPRWTYSKRYKRYRAERLCVALARMRPRWAAKIIGLTQADISTRLPGYRDHAVFGLADWGGRAAVISTFRLRRSRLLRPHTFALWRKLVTHEVGHLFGLKHCAGPCVMQNAHARPQKLLGLPAGLCKRCRTKRKRLQP